MILCLPMSSQSVLTSTNSGKDLKHFVLPLMERLDLGNIQRKCIDSIGKRNCSPFDAITSNQLVAIVGVWASVAAYALLQHPRQPL